MTTDELQLECKLLEVDEDWLKDQLKWKWFNRVLLNHKKICPHDISSCMTQW
jgi:hypothetical protein